MDQKQAWNGRQRSWLADRSRAIWFAEHVLPHEPGLRRWLSRRCSALGLEIDDIVQESYALLAGRTRIDDILNPRAYLYQTAHSLILRAVRRARIVPILTLEDLGAEAFADQGASPERAAEDRNLLDNVAGVIQAMPAKTREAFYLRRVQGVSQREIAQRMGITEKAVEKLIARGIRWMANRFTHEGGDRPVRVSIEAECGET